MTNVATELETVMDRLLPPLEGPEQRVLEAMRYVTLAGGKRFRPFLVATSASLFGVSRASALRAGAAVELVHTYSLVHDDLPCMDDDDLRRGHPTAHVKYDEATAVLTGDALLTLAFEILADERTHSNPKVRLELIATLAAASGANGMVGGQMIDIAADGHDHDIGSITRLQQMKTGALITFSAQAGAVLGRAGKEKRLALKAFAHDLGLAFQIADDLLDTDGSAEEMGKAVGKDADQGKATFVSILGKDRARTQAELLAQQATKHLGIFDGESAALLRAVAGFVVNRRN
ncbi:MAG: polyprenyl synthetase family protein [Sphingomonadales bacterium]